jgi:hypothetical protein
MNGNTIRMSVRSIVFITALLGAQFASASDTFADKSTEKYSVSGSQGLNFKGEQRGRGHGQVPVTSPVPEPETYTMMLVGLGLMGVIARRRKKTSQK